MRLPKNKIGKYALIGLALYIAFCILNTSYIFFSNHFHKNPGTWHSQFNRRIDNSEERERTQSIDEYEAMLCEPFQQRWRTAHSLDEMLKQMELMADDVNARYSKSWPITEGYIRYHFSPTKNASSSKIFSDLTEYWATEEGQTFLNQVRNTFGLYYINLYNSLAAKSGVKPGWTPLTIHDDNSVSYDVITHDPKTLKTFWQEAIIHTPPTHVLEVFNKHGYEFLKAEPYERFHYIYSYDQRKLLEVFFGLPRYFSITFEPIGRRLPDGTVDNITLDKMDCDYPNDYFYHWAGPEPSWKAPSYPEYQKCENYRFNVCVGYLGLKNTCNSLETSAAKCPGEWEGRLTSY